MALGSVGIPAFATVDDLNFKTSLTVKEAYDSNVYLQDEAPSPLVANAVPAKKDSWVTTITPRVSFDYYLGTSLKMALSYAPDVVFYHNAHSEDHFAHRAGLTLSSGAENLVWEQANAFIYIDGSRLGPIFGRPQDVPAVGGIPLRDRRDAFIYRGGFKLTYTVDRFFLRPVASAYVHDFKTLQLTLTAPAVYENYIDRQDVNGGLDVGYDVGKETFLVVGYRYGQQEQFKLLGVNSPYDSAYHRILLGVEGSPASWIKLAVLGGPEIRDFSARARQISGFDANEMLYWVNAVVTLLPTENDTVSLLVRRYEQPAFASPSVYEDITYNITWKREFNSHWAASAGFTLYIGDWQAPADREDWIYTPSVSVAYTHDEHLSAELAYSYDWVDNQVPAIAATYGDGREFTRHLVSLGVKYTF